MDPAYFAPRAISDRGEAGSWRAPEENTPEGAVAGVVYPVHRDATLRRFVILNAEGNRGEAERRLMLDTGSTVSDAPIPGFDPDGGDGDRVIEAAELDDDPTF